MCGARVSVSTANNCLILAIRILLLRALPGIGSLSGCCCLGGAIGPRGASSHRNECSFRRFALNLESYTSQSMPTKRRRGNGSWFKRHALTSSYPNRTIRLVVPFVPGGGVDTLARMFAEKISPSLG